MSPEQIAEGIVDKWDPDNYHPRLKEAIAAAIQAERDKLEETRRNLDMYMDKVSDLGMEAQREVIWHIDTRKERDALKAQLKVDRDRAREVVKPFAEAASVYDNNARDAYMPPNVICLGHCRAAARFMEEIAEVVTTSTKLAPPPSTPYHVPYE